MRACYARDVRILTHYFARRYAGLFFLVLLAILLVVGALESLIQFAREATPSSPNAAVAAAADATGAASAPLAALRQIGFRLASYYLPDALPIASFVASFATLALTGRSLERLAAETGGVRPARFLIPILAMAGILSLASGLLHETLVLASERHAAGVRLATRSDNDIDFAQRAFWVQRGPFITNVGHADPETRMLFDVEIFERSESGGIVRVLRSPEVEITPSGAWRMAHADEWRFDPMEFAGDPEWRRRDALVLDLDTTDASLLVAADPALLPLPQLAEALDGTEDASSRSDQRLRHRFHERLSRPWLVLLFAGLAMPFGLRVDERGRIAGPALAALAGLALFFVTQSFARTLSIQGWLPIVAPTWGAIGLFCVLAAVGGLWRVRR